MANLTIVIEDDVLLRARNRALDQGTSVNVLLRSCLESYVGQQNRAEAMKKFVQRATSAKLRSGKVWTRDELHER
jgi:hypothetical protein